ncbi:hypothetical protein [Priestia endophytica]|uniref:hypothetical protein n=1 Tax=Priestia endophytica TaxID=135735 RepID=UPI00124E03FF|nr:hypothetical protein [Priestia endophytica]KAB2494674.1 hypothetical protein F8155_08885 [Priestia endophytica]
MAFFIVISLILHVISFFCITLLYMKRSEMKRIEQAQKRSAKELEETMAAYLLELQEEHHNLIKSLKKSRENNIKKPNRTEFNTVSKPEDLSDLLPSLQTQEDTIETYLAKLKIDELEGEKLRKTVYFLHDRGLISKEIAKHLHRGDAEIRLFLQFRQENRI